MLFTVKRKKIANASLSFLHDFTPKGKTYDWEQTSHFSIEGALNWRNNQRKMAERNKRVKINQIKKHLDLLTVKTAIIN